MDNPSIDYWLSSKYFLTFKFEKYKNRFTQNWIISFGWTKTKLLKSIETILCCGSVVCGQTQAAKTNGQR